MNKKNKKAIPDVSDYASRKEWEAAYWEKIIESKGLLRLLMTSYERHNLVLRAATMEGLSVGKSYRKIGEELWISPQTVSGIKKALHEKMYRSYMERSKKERKKKTYSISSRQIRRRPEGIPRRTKYGTLYMP